MTIVSKSNNTITSSFLEVVKLPSQHPLFKDVKENGLQILQEYGLPSTKEEEYKFTAISKKIENSIRNFGHAKPIENLGEQQVRESKLADLDAEILVLNNGQYDQELSSVKDVHIKYKKISDLPEEWIEQNLGKIASAESDPFAALNAAAFQDGLFIEIPNGMIIEKPVLLLHFVQADEVGQCIHPRLFIKVGKNAEVTFIEKVVHLDESPLFHNAVNEILVDENSHVHHYKIQDYSKQALEVNNTETNVHRDAGFTSTVVSLQGDMIRNNLTLNLLDSNCEGNMYGLYLLNGQCHVDNHTNVDHIMPHALSNELYKGILADKSRGVFNGKIFVRQDAQKTNAFQQNNNILLSEEAIINTKPQLEIWADDVKCSHGCTTGQLDEEALFYIRSRGISKENAKGLLLYAFAGEVLEKIKNETFRNYCIDLVQQRLGSNF